MTESAVTGEAIEEAATQIPEVITQVPNSTTENLDGGDIMPIDLVEHGKIKVKRTEDKDNVNNWLKRGAASGSYFDSDNHYFYVVSGTDEATGRNVSTVAYCLQSNKTGPDDDGEVEYEEGRGALFTSSNQDDIMQITNGLAAIALFGFGGSGGYENDGGTYGTYYLDTGDGKGVTGHRGLLIAGIFFGIDEPDAARAATQAAIHNYCSNKGVNDNINADVINWGTNTPNQAARAMREMAEAAYQGGLETASQYKAMDNNTYIKIRLYDNGTYVDAPANLGTIPESKCITKNGKKYLQFRVYYQFMYCNTTVDDIGNYFIVNKPTSGTVIQFNGKQASANTDSFLKLIDSKGYSEKFYHVYTFSQTADVYVPYSELQEKSGQNVILSAETNTINTFTPVSKGNHSAIRIYSSDIYQSMGFFSPCEHKTLSVSASFCVPKNINKYRTNFRGKYRKTDFSLSRKLYFVEIGL